jgi:hypothetical protein
MDRHLRATTDRRSTTHTTMANTLLIEGSFEELSEELAVYIDGLSQSSVQSEVAPLLKEGNKVDALKKIVTASSALNSAPEKGELFFPSLSTLSR